MSDASPHRQPLRVGASVYRRDAPMTTKGRVTAVWWSPKTSSWHAMVTFGAGQLHLGADELMEVPRNG